MPGIGKDVIAIGSTRIGQSYVLGADVPLDNPNWQGPWDCAEFASWCAYQAYGIVFGAGKVAKVAKAEPYSGHWYSEGRKPGIAVPWRRALGIEGAFLVRKPRKKLIGHVAISLGNGRQTLEARSRNLGLGKFDKAGERPWDIGVLLPGVDYGDETIVDDRPTADNALDPGLPSAFLAYGKPMRAGADVVALQRALAAMGVDPGPIDGKFGSTTAAALVSFQAREGLEVDGILGPVTAKALDLKFPVTPSAADREMWAALNRRETPAPVVLPATPGAADTVSAVRLKSGVYVAETAGGHTFRVGTRVPYTDDMHRVGLHQVGRTLKEIDQFGVYAAADFEDQFGPWAFFIEPTLSAEGGGRFARLNTYDRAAFTFGAPQLAAHTPKKNFVLYLRALLQLANADMHFPDLSLRANAAGERTIHLKRGSAFKDLEEVVRVKRPNGVMEDQLARLMAYLNSSPTEVDGAEQIGAARLMNWLRCDPAARGAQIQVFIDSVKTNLQRAKQKLPAFTGQDWRIALWIMDILHQGRGTFREMNAALKKPKPLTALADIGASRYRSRVKEIASGIQKLETSGKLNGFVV
jgi:hypothetical protein